MQLDRSYTCVCWVAERPGSFDESIRTSSLSNTTRRVSQSSFLPFVYLPPVSHALTFPRSTKPSHSCAGQLLSSKPSLPFLVSAGLLHPHSSRFAGQLKNQDGNRPCVPSGTEEQRRHGRSGVRGRGGEPAVAAVAEAAAGHELLRAMQGPRRRAQERVQHVLPRLRQRRALPSLPRPPPRPPRHPDTAVVVPRRDPGVGDTAGAGHRRCADVHHQQRARGVPERAAAAEARQGGHQHLRRLRAQPPRHFPLLLPRMQDCRHVRRTPPEEETKRQRQRRRRRRPEEEEEEGGGQGRAVGVGALVHQQQRQEQRGAELHAVDPAARLQQPPHRQQAPEGRPAPVAVRQPHRGVLGQQACVPALINNTL